MIDDKSPSRYLRLEGLRRLRGGMMPWAQNMPSNHTESCDNQHQFHP